jgi:hypothetical protein
VLIRHRLAVISFISCLIVAPAAGSLIINPSFTGVTAGEQTVIEAAISEIEASITSPNNLTVNVLYGTMTMGLGESTTSTYTLSYYDYYNDLKAVATSPAQLTALASLGPAPINESSTNPVNGSTEVSITSAEGRNLGLNTPGGVSGTYDSFVQFNIDLTTPPGDPSNPSLYPLEAIILHETDEVLGIGGSGSTIGGGPAVGDLDLYRYSAPGVRSYTTNPNAISYFSIDGGNTVLSYFNQTSGADYADWLSNPIPNGFNPQVQDAFGEPGTNPSLGPNELLAFNAIGYQVTAPEPSTLLLGGITLALGYWIVRRKRRVA